MIMIFKKIYINLVDMKLVKILVKNEISLKILLFLTVITLSPRVTHKDELDRQFYIRIFIGNRNNIFTVKCSRCDTSEMET